MVNIGNGMSRTYKATVSACFCFGVILGMAAIWYNMHIRDCLTQSEGFWGTVFLTAFGILVTPLFWLKVTVDDEGIRARVFVTRSIRWVDIVSWERESFPGGDGPDRISIKARGGSLTLNHNCIYGKRLEEIESELRRRVPSLSGSPNGKGNERF